MRKLDHNHERAQTTPHNEHISGLRIGYTGATHSAVMDKEPSPECPFCAVNLTTDHILWQCKETETKRLQTGITKEIWKGGDGKTDQVRNRILRRNIASTGVRNQASGVAIQPPTFDLLTPCWFVT
jgi:hypothetical protein